MSLFVYLCPCPVLILRCGLAIKVYLVVRLVEIRLQARKSIDAAMVRGLVQEIVAPL